MRIIHIPPTTFGTLFAVGELRSQTGSSTPRAYCAHCKHLAATTLIRGHNGARDHRRCTTCGRTWPT